MIASMRAELVAHSEPHKLPIMQRFFKEPIDAYCTYTEHVRRISQRHARQFAEWARETRKELTDELWQSGKFEEGSLAIQLHGRILRHCGPRDFMSCSAWLDRYVANWAHCDALCAEVLGLLLIRHPEWVTQVADWSRSKRLYKRRASAVVLLKGFRSGLFDRELRDVESILAGDKEDLIKKAVRWIRAERKRKQS